MVSNRKKSEDIQANVYNTIKNAERYSVWDIKKLQLATQTKTYDAVYKSIIRLDSNGALAPLVVWDKIGGNRVMVRK